MLKFTLLIILIFSLHGCSHFSNSNFSKNFVKQGTFALKGGVKKKFHWKDHLTFQRVSWFKELSLYYEVLMVKLDAKTPFLNWFTLNDVDRIRDCQEFIVAIHYALDSARISHKMFDQQMLQNGFEYFAVPTFISNLKGHPDYESSLITKYRVSGYCNFKKKVEKVIVEFPGFNEQNIIF